MESTILAIVLVALFAYLLGSISFAVVVSRIYAHDDVRKYGSHNAGMTNVLRVYGKVPALFTFLGDFFKGAVAVVLGRWIFRLMGIDGLDAGYIAGIFALLGHLFPLYFGFKGGKGVLTSMGIMLAINPIVLAVLAAILIPVLFLVKIVSLISVTGALLYPLVTYMVRVFQQRPALTDTLFALVFSVLVVWMHRENIKRLLNGTEKKISLTPQKKQTDKDGDHASEHK